MMIFILLSLLAGVLGQISPNLSFSPEDIERGFRALDSNIDGSLEPNEVFVLYDSIDIDGDGFVSMEEFTRFLPSGYPPKEVQGMFKYCDKLDGTNDDRIGRTNINSLFEILDTDDSGEVSLAEFLKNMPLIVSGMLEEVQP
ncbi:probable calcium-binding protein CML10 [Pomacea canaliculata]|uniref:probable calcium-binding protein CML10 n=1 Tax=Pomacea canaliculata TaxID=400727 RepID=UPI000D7355D0|nr:probable calcium-binding protein CML10 [Pomacea canaliculata]